MLHITLTPPTKVSTETHTKDYKYHLQLLFGMVLCIEAKELLVSSEIQKGLTFHYYTL